MRRNLPKVPDGLVMFVGSIPADTARQARRFVLRRQRLAPNVVALTDGETNEGAPAGSTDAPIAAIDRERRSNWLVGQLRAWVDSPALVPVDPGQATVGYDEVTYDNMVTFEKRPGLGRRLRVEDLLPLGIADHARRAAGDSAIA